MADNKGKDPQDKKGLSDYLGEEDLSYGSFMDQTSFVSGAEDGVDLEEKLELLGQEVHLAQTTGVVRKKQEDVCFVTSTDARNHVEAETFLGEAIAQAAEATKDHKMQGATGSIAYLTQDNQLTCAWLGDSPVFLLVRQKSNGAVRAKEITESHKPGDAKEKDRIEKAGFKVEDDQIKFGRGGHLGIARAFGDTHFGDAVSKVPDIKTVDLSKYMTPEYEVVILVGSDGLCDRYQDPTVGEEFFQNHLASCSNLGEVNLAQFFVDAAFPGGMNQPGADKKKQSTDNVTAVAIPVSLDRKGDIVIGVLDGHGGKEAALAAAQCLNSELSVEQGTFLEREDVAAQPEEGLFAKNFEKGEKPGELGATPFASSFEDGEEVPDFEPWTRKPFLSSGEKAKRDLEAARAEAEKANEEVAELTSALAEAEERKKQLEEELATQGEAVETWRSHANSWQEYATKTLQPELERVIASRQEATRQLSEAQERATRAEANERDTINVTIGRVGQLSREKADVETKLAEVQRELEDSKQDKSRIEELESQKADLTQANERLERELTEITDGMEQFKVAAQEVAAEGVRAAREELAEKRREYDELKRKADEDALAVKRLEREAGQAAGRANKAELEAEKLRTELTEEKAEIITLTDTNQTLGESLARAKDLARTSAARLEENEKELATAKSDLERAEAAKARTERINVELKEVTETALDRMEAAEALAEHNRELLNEAEDAEVAAVESLQRTQKDLERVTDYLHEAEEAEEQALEQRNQANQARVEAELAAEQADREKTEALAKAKSADSARAEAEEEARVANVNKDVALTRAERGEKAAEEAKDLAAAQARRAEDEKRRADDLETDLEGVNIELQKTQAELAEREDELAELEDAKTQLADALSRLFGIDVPVSRAEPSEERSRPVRPRRPVHASDATMIPLDEEDRAVAFAGLTDGDRGDIDMGSQHQEHHHGAGDPWDSDPSGPPIGPPVQTTFGDPEVPDEWLERVQRNAQGLHGWLEQENAKFHQTFIRERGRPDAAEINHVIKHIGLTGERLIGNAEHIAGEMGIEVRDSRFLSDIEKTGKVFQECSNPTSVPKDASGMAAYLKNLENVAECLVNYTRCVRRGEGVEEARDELYESFRTLKISNELYESGIPGRSAREPSPQRETQVVTNDPDRATTTTTTHQTGDNRVSTKTHVTNSTTGVTNVVDNKGLYVGERLADLGVSAMLVTGVAGALLSGGGIPAVAFLMLGIGGMHFAAERKENEVNKVHVGESKVVGIGEKISTPFRASLMCMQDAWVTARQAGAVGVGFAAGAGVLYSAVVLGAPFMAVGLAVLSVASFSARNAVTSPRYEKPLTNITYSGVLDGPVTLDENRRPQLPNRPRQRANNREEITADISAPPGESSFGERELNRRGSSGRNRERS